MIRWLIKNTAEIRVESEEDANELHKQYEQFAHDNNYTLSSWTQTYRCKKAQGEIVDSWYICKVVLIFNDAKEPEIALKNIEFNMVHNFEEVKEENMPWEE